MNKDITIPGVCAEAVMALKDAERGRLILAVMVYQREGRELSLCGGERYLWPEFKAVIDEKKAEEVALRLKNSENGRKGGRPKSHENPKKAVAFSPPSSPLESPDNPCINNINNNYITNTGNKEKEKGGTGGKGKGKNETALQTKPKKKKAPFRPPTLDEVRAYCTERQNGIDPEDFLDFYETNGWVQGKSCKPIVDWKACVRTWERSRRNQQPFEQQGELMRQEAPRSLGVQVIDGEEVAIFEKS